MKKILSVALIVGFVASGTWIGAGVAGTFTQAPSNVPMRWDATETNIPDSSTISFGTDQDITVSYNATSDLVNVGGVVAVSSVIVGSGTENMTGCIRYSGGKVFIYNGSNWDNLTVAQTPTPTPSPVPTATPTP